MSQLLEVYKSLFVYFKVYCATESATVAKWRHGDLSNALKWCDVVGEIYAKVRHKKLVLPRFLADVTVLKTQWEVSAELDVEDMLKRSHFYIRKVSDDYHIKWSKNNVWFQSLLSNKNLNYELRMTLLDKIFLEQVRRVVFYE